MERRELLKVAALILGSAVSGSCTRAIESGQDLNVAPDDGPLSDLDMSSIARLAELIIPRTDTPGAIDAGVPAFIHKIIAEWYRPEEREIFLRGLHALDEISTEGHGQLFMDLDEQDQVAILTALESETLPDGPASAGAAGDSPFITKLKELTVLGYYTSEVGATQELAYLPMPGRYDGHAKFDDLGRLWTLGN